MNTARNFLVGHLLLGAGVLLLLGGCGPTYPNCNADQDCAARGEFCVNGTCRVCRDDSACGASDPCRVCNGYQCVRRTGCCTSDADCPNGRCWNSPGHSYGECGAQCGAGKPCPPGQRCNAQGTCEPDAECSASVPCPPGKQCQNGHCVGACTMEAVRFDYNESRIRLDQQDTLNADAECAKTRGQSFRVEGHCDERGTEEYNLALGERRASAAKRYLQNLGVSSSAMRIISYGEEKPSCSASNESCWAENRRAEFSFE